MVKHLCEDTGVLLLYLPPYSPDFNLIEEFFSVLKSWIKRHYEEANSISFNAFLELAVTANSGGYYAKAHFLHAGVHIS